AAGPAAGGNGESGRADSKTEASGNGGNGGQTPAAAAPAASALTDQPPVIPAVRAGLDLGPACRQCGGMMQRTGSCYTCSSCGFNTGCGRAELESARRGLAPRQLARADPTAAPRRPDGAAA